MRKSFKAAVSAVASAAMVASLLATPISAYASADIGNSVDSSTNWTTPTQYIDNTVSVDVDNDGTNETAKVITTWANAWALSGPDYLGVSNAGTLSQSGGSAASSNYATEKSSTMLGIWASVVNEVPNAYNWNYFYNLYLTYSNEVLDSTYGVYCTQETDSTDSSTYYAPITDFSSYSEGDSVYLATVAYEEGEWGTTSTDISSSTYYTQTTTTSGQGPNATTTTSYTAITDISSLTEVTELYTTSDSVTYELALTILPDITSYYYADDSGNYVATTSSTSDCDLYSVASKSYYAYASETTTVDSDQVTAVDVQNGADAQWDSASGVWSPFKYRPEVIWCSNSLSSSTVTTYVKYINAGQYYTSSSNFSSGTYAGKDSTYYIDGDEDYDPYVVSGGSGGLGTSSNLTGSSSTPNSMYDQVDALYDLAGYCEEIIDAYASYDDTQVSEVTWKTMNSLPRTTRYEASSENAVTARECALDLEKVMRGSIWYVMEEIAKGSVTKKEVAYITSMSSTSSTATVAVIDGVEETRGSCAGKVGATAVVTTCTGSSGTLETSDNETSSGTTSATAADLLGADVIWAANSDLSVADVQSWLTTNYGSTPSEYPAIITDVPAIMNGHNFTSEKMLLELYSLNFIYSNVFSNLELVTYWYDNIYHIKNDSNGYLTTCMTYGLGSCTLPSDVDSLSSLPATNYKASNIDTYAKTGYKYYVSSSNTEFYDELAPSSTMMAWATSSSDDLSGDDLEDAAETIEAADYDIADCTVSLSQGEIVAYTGSEITQTVTVTSGETTLTKDTDYEVSGTTSATDEGTYTITITGIGYYTGTSQTVTWYIGTKTESDTTTSTESSTDDSGNTTETTTETTTTTVTDSDGNETTTTTTAVTTTVTDSEGNATTTTATTVTDSSGNSTGTATTTSDGTTVTVADTTGSTSWAAGATVTVTDSTGSTVATVTAGSDGSIDLSSANLSDGTYTITISASGYEAVTSTLVKDSTSGSTVTITSSTAAGTKATSTGTGTTATSLTNPVKVKAKTVTVKGKYKKNKLKKAMKVAASKCFKITGNKGGKVSYSPSKITIKKGTKKGKTVSAKVTVKIAKKGSYKAYSKKFTVKIKLK